MQAYRAVESLKRGFRALGFRALGLGLVSQHERFKAKLWLLECFRCSGLWAFRDQGLGIRAT